MEKYLRKIKQNNFRLALSGDILVVFSLGSIFSIALVTYSYWIMLISLLIGIIFGYNMILTWYNKNKLRFKEFIVAYIAIILLAVYLGMQNPQILFKKYLLLLGILMVIPAIVNIIKK